MRQLSSVQESGLHKSLLLAVFLIWLACLPTVSAAQANSPSQPVPTLTNVSYGPHANQSLDFYKAPSGKPTPLLFFVHGGGWMNGDKAKPDFTEKWLASGVSVVSINYRLIPDAIAQKVDPPVKACLNDCARALQFVRSKAKEWNIDKARIAGCGGSAGGFNVLWLAFHNDMAAPKSADPISRESTRLSCVLAFVPQTSLDPAQMRQWIANNDYGHHAFALPSYQSFLDKRDALKPYIAEFSPFGLATPDDPPVYLFYDSPVVMGQSWKDPPHSANFGAGLAEKLKKIGVECEFNYQGGPPVKHPDLISFVLERIQAVPQRRSER